MVGDFFTKPLEGSLFIKMCNYIMGNEEPGYQVLRRSVLSTHDISSIRKQKCIGTRNHNSEAVAETNHKHVTNVTKDSDSSTKDGSSENIKGTTLHTMDGNERSTEHRGGGGEQRGDRNKVVEPQSYRDALVNGDVMTKW